MRGAMSLLPQNLGILHRVQKAATSYGNEQSMNCHDQLLYEQIAHPIVANRYLKQLVANALNRGP